MRAVIYARYSSDLQSEASNSDQIEVCRRYAASRGWTVVNVYSDAAISGASRHRPEFLRMMADSELDQFDAVICEAVDRLGRRLADTADLFDRLVFRKIRLYAPSLGEITSIHVAVMGMMAQMTLRDLGEKTKRGQLGRILSGRSAGGIAYGYRPVRDGEPGAREIVEGEAKIVRRNFCEYGSGLSPERVARQLNAEAIPGPGGRPWSNTTIRGQRIRGTGVLNNDLYRGVLVWNRCSYVKDPQSGKRVARPNPPDSWESIDVPHLRIVDDTLWIQAKSRQERIERSYRFAAQDVSSIAGEGRNLNGTHRPRFLLSGLLKCGCCGGGYTIVAAGRYGCSNRRQKGLCHNARTIMRNALESRVLDGLKTRLLAPDLVAEFVAEFHAESLCINRAKKGEARQRARRAAELDRKIDGLLCAIEDGMYHSSMKQRLADLEAQKAELECTAPHGSAHSVDVLLHPSVPELYRRKVEELEAALDQDPDAYEARELIRSMIDRIELRPRRTGEGLDAILYGDLAAILGACSAASEPGRNKRAGGSKGSQLSVVAGARNHLDLQLEQLLRG